MKVVVNDKEEALEGALTVRQLLEQLGLAAAPCAVEVNRQLIPKRQHEAHVLSDGDRVEIVTLVGGG